MLPRQLDPWGIQGTDSRCPEDVARIAVNLPHNRTRRVELLDPFTVPKGHERVIFSQLLSRATQHRSGGRTRSGDALQPGTASSIRRTRSTISSGYELPG